MKIRAPKYEQIAEEIRKRIRDGIYQTKTAIPDQNTLAKEFGVSRMTIKKSLDGLSMAGLIYTRRGDGTYVLGDIPLKIDTNSPAQKHTGLTAELGSRLSSQVIQFTTIMPTEELMEHLKINHDEPVLNIIRLRLVNKEPYVLEHTYMPKKLMPNLNNRVLKHSIYNYLEKDLNLKLGGAYRKIHADFSNNLDIRYLGSQPNDPILEVEQVAWLQNGIPFEYSFSRNKYDTRSYTVLDINPANA